MKVLIRKQRDEIYTVLSADDGNMPDNDSLDSRYVDTIRIFSLVGPVGLSLLLRTDVGSIHAMKVGETIHCELAARIINDSDQKEESWQKVEIIASSQAAALTAMGIHLRRLQS